MAGNPLYEFKDVKEVALDISIPPISPIVSRDKEAKEMLKMLKSIKRIYFKGDKG